MYLFFDTETTGLPKSWQAPISDLDNWPRMVQLAWQTYDLAGNMLATGEHIIKPEGFKIPKEASDIHGITTRRANKEGENLQEVLVNFGVLVKDCDYLVAHNMNFDARIVGAEFLRKSMPNLIPKKEQLCTMESTTEYVGIKNYYGYKWPKLSELHYKLFKCDFENAHNAAADVSATAKCFWELRKQKRI